ncbi:hypothetical protein FGE12_15410 [Aggregicoccus sp. 17bor-14]|uniref:hypothetical protein n=1 Tax=Myxococcaceae TaxID=31 RepID=UPI00129CB3CA|nr:MULTISPECIES: hypothetical protein [Myxococcaceae]MBF5043784.1 hypothetical protein [Simulacricoccus sp. 17bor-14]MRI89538.1 hypothetical protein [Aggregicoccus sp. 17bor-14]
MRLPLASLLVPLLLSACQRPAPAEPAAAAEAPAPRAAPAAEPLPPLLALRLAQEAEARPTGTPRAEEVLAALQRAGLHLGEHQQYLASASGARYCYGARSQRGLRLSVCEYGDVASARAARQRVLRALGSPERAVLLNRATTLQLQRPVGSPDAEAEARTAAQAFQKL